MYDFEGKQGGSIKKSVDYVVPYAKGDKQHEEWVNTTVSLDKRRAEAGLAKYQPGILFNPKKSLSMFEWALYYDPTLLDVIALLQEGGVSWVSMLNSPLIRN